MLGPAEGRPELGSRRGDAPSNGFVFDTEVIFQAVHFELPVAEVPVSTRYFADASWP